MDNRCYFNCFMVTWFRGFSRLGIIYSSLACDRDYCRAYKIDQGAKGNIKYKSYEKNYNIGGSVVCNGLYRRL